MPDQAPGIFGVDGLTKAVRALETTLTKRVDALTRTVEALSRRLDGRLERIGSTLMAGQQDLEQAISDLTTTLENEIGQINTKLDDLRGQVAPDLQPQVDEIRALTQRVSGIIDDAVPAPEPTPPARRK